VIKGAIPPLCERLGDQIGPEDAATLAATAGVVPAFLLRDRDRFAPLHGDYRLDNLMFAPAGASVAAVDWQTLSCGLPGRDVAYLIATSLSVEDRRRHEHDLVEAHRDGLAAHGVRGYDHELAFEDYRVGLMQCPLVIVLGAAFSTRTERGDAMFAAMIRRSSAAIRELDTIGLLTGN
jgi:aminoglycoside phosphotransferase (APT) family kinase protein